MAKSADSRLDMLVVQQNADGGWGYFPGRQSWLEPTAYALLALAGGGRRGSVLERGLRLVHSWQLPGGGWRPCAGVNEPHWTAALAVTLLARTGGSDGALRRGVEWLVASRGSEGGAAARLVHWLKPGIVEFDPSLRGWPWHVGDFSWIEPTAHTLLALKEVAKRRPADAGALLPRIETGERMLVERRCPDGGWNYGNRRVLGVDLPSYPETTALALLALDGNTSIDMESALAKAERWGCGTASKLARAWFARCLAHYRGSLPWPLEPEPGKDIMIAAVEAMACNRTGV